MTDIQLRDKNILLDKNTPESTLGQDHAYKTRIQQPDKKTTITTECLWINFKEGDEKLP